MWDAPSPRQAARNLSAHLDRASGGGAARRPPAQCGGSRTMGWDSPGDAGEVGWPVHNPLYQLCV